LWLVFFARHGLARLLGRDDERRQGIAFFAAVLERPLALRVATHRGVADRVTRVLLLDAPVARAEERTRVAVAAVGGRLGVSRLIRGRNAMRRI
jgi:hypothetical protein